MSPKLPQTPPSSEQDRATVALPPSPPLSPARSSPAGHLLYLVRLVRLHRAGKLANPQRHDWRPYHLNRRRFAHLQRLFAEDPDLTDSYRWDYDGSEWYHLRMPTRVHERFTALVDEAIYSAANQHESLRGLVYQGRSTTLELRAPKLENSSQESQGEDIVVYRSPDATFYNRKRDALPTLVVEVSYSQARKDLSRLAESYIVDSRHAIRCVVGLDIPYNKRGGDATVSVWRPGVENDEDGEEIGVCECHVDAAPFRTHDGDVCEGNLVLNCEDFVPEGYATPAGSSITIPFSTLARFVQEALAQEENTAANKPTSVSAPKKFRKRKRSPSEELSDGREAAYLKLEEAELQKERDIDDEWKGIGWSEVGALQESVEHVVETRRSKRTKSGRSGSEGS